MVGKTNYEVHYDIKSPLPLAEVDRELFSILWLNLILNAIEAMPYGGKIYIKIYPILKEERTFLRIVLQDEGSGIPEKYLPHIFEPFFTTKPGGSGLGLYVVKEVVKATEEKFLVKKEKKGLAQRILLMDEETIRTTLKELLESFNYKVETAINGESALQIFESSLKAGSTYDCVILDLIVPGNLSGFETYQRMKTLYPEIQVIIITGYSDEPILHNYKEYGLKGVLIKPFSIQKLISLLEE